MMRWIRKRAQRKEKGQAAIEFILIMVVLFFFLLFFLAMAILFVTSDYIEYATFMTARTLKSGSANKNQQQINAKKVFDSYVERVQGVARNFKLEFLDGLNNDPQGDGVLAQYEMDMFYLPPLFLLGEGGSAGQSRIKLFSEAHLGRETSFEECQSFFSSMAARLGFDNVTPEQLDDNGC